ncbi:MAG: hypothetical protein LBE39_09200 [Flavobacteriaceae bacterium]|jgi:hypothetical protein|nr:hypothetical protein [Flavobacteriaceae bacterium]
MKKIVLLASLTLIFTSCGRSGDNTNEVVVDPVVETPILPAKISGSWGVETIKYNGNKLSEIISSDSKTVFEYSGSLITKTISYDNSGVQIGTADFVYSNGTLTNVSYNATNNKKTFVYSYPDANTVVKTRVRNYSVAGEPMIDKEDITYTLKNGNIVSEEMVYYHNNKLYGNISSTYTYDDKNNVYKNILGFDKIKVYLFADLKDYIGSGSNNNLLTKSQTHITVAGETSKYKNVYSNSYSSSGYPIQIISKQYGTNNQQQGDTITNFFVYNK